QNTLLHRRKALRWLPVSCSLPMAGCAGAQSALAPAGREAERIAQIFWGMTAGSAVIWLAGMILAMYAARSRPEGDRRRQARWIIVGGGAATTILLAVLAVYGLRLLPPLVAHAPEGTLRIAVYGELWWWRVRYEPPGKQPFELANEVRLAVSEPAEFLLHSHNVIHSFWIPSLGGKMDLIPGRVNRLLLHPTKTGTFRGACAEYCGTAHAQMTFQAIVMPRD